jgi:hypothetical protein
MSPPDFDVENKVRTNWARVQAFGGFYTARTITKKGVEIFGFGAQAWPSAVLS